MYVNSFPSNGLITHGDIDDPKSRFILSSATALTASIKYFGLNPISKFFPTLSTINSSLTSPDCTTQAITITFSDIVNFKYDSQNIDNDVRYLLKTVTAFYI